MTLPKAIQQAIAAAPKDPDVLREVDALRKLSVPELVARYTEVWGKPPGIKHKVHLWKRIAWKLQEARTGKLSSLAKARLEELIAEINIDFEDRSRTVSGVLARPRRPGALSPGTTITREYHGQQIVVRVLDDWKLEWNGVPYRSLSAVAKAITGSHWNGRLFFGLSKPKEASA